MGRMKELFINIMNANEGVLPEEITSADVARMRDMQIYEWKEYTRRLKEKQEKEKNGIIK